MKPQIPGQYEPQPNLKDLIHEEGQSESLGSVKEHYDWLKDSAIFDKRFESFYAHFLINDREPVPINDWISTTDGSVHQILRQQLGNPTAAKDTKQSCIDILEFSRAINKGFNANGQVTNHLTFDLYPRFWLMLKLNLVDNQAAKECWHILKRDYFDQAQGVWLDTPQ
jgi:hypothetical protein